MGLLLRKNARDAAVFLHFIISYESGFQDVVYDVVAFQ